MKMSFKGICLLVAFISCGATAIAQEEGAAQHHISLSYGGMYMTRFDAVYSRLPRFGGSHYGRLGYEYQSAKHLISSAVDFSIGILGVNNSTVGELYAFNAAVRLKYLTRIAAQKIKEEKFKLYLGGSIGFRGELWFPVTSVLAYGWDLNLGLNLEAVAQYQITPKLWLRYDFSLHSLGILWRPHNNGQQLITEELQKEGGTIAAAFETPRFAHVANAFYLDNQISLGYAFNKHWTIHYAFVFNYKHINQPLRKKGFDINNVIGITYKF